MPPNTGETGISSSVLKEVYSGLLNQVLEDYTLDFCFKIHRALKLDYFAIDEYIVREGKLILYDPAIPDHNQNHEFFVFANSKKPSHIICPHCHRKLGTNRFAPHLNSCMNDGGRQNKDRNAKRTCQIYDSGDDDDDEDYSDSGRKKKKKTTKNSRRNYKPKKPVKVNLLQKCGVVSLKTKTMCQNTLKCGMHSDEQRREVRRLFLKSEPDPNVHIDVDTVDEVSRSPSPSDFSLDSNNSTLSVKLEDGCSTPEQPRLTPSNYS